ncbi:hypothetical protein [Singulisphaera sp. PoT]|uniref:hypothetical protein n=1 Tax=Singulisphaera sp. PoT TaxID=3411797 RepID=UPI003BF5E1FE
MGSKAGDRVLPAGPANDRTRADGAKPRLLALLAYVLASTLAAAPPDVISVQVPASKVDTVFPVGTQLRGTTAAELDTLVTKAREGSRQESRETPPRLLRAKHTARWDQGALIGRSELIVANEAGRPAVLTLSPWSPAITRSDEKANRLRMSDGGQTAVLVDPTDSTITLGWQLQARPNSSGKGFSLGLPESVTTSLELELPAGWVPEGVEGIWQGPREAGDASRKLWQFDGRGGQLNLRISDRNVRGIAPTDMGVWVSGPTRVELAEASANWTTDWEVQLAPRGTRRIQVELDPGLEFLDATGPGVESSSAEIVENRTRVSVQFSAKLTGSTHVKFRAFTRVPSEGPWAIPAIRPIDALWTGGRTSLKLDASRIISACREQAGRRVAPEPKEVSEGNLVVFEANEPKSVAVLDFSRPKVEASVEVQGQLQLGNSAPRLEARCTWRLQRGVLLGLDVDLPPAWVPELVQFEGISAAPAWHSESRPGGEVRVHVMPPSGDFSRNDLVLVVAATATFPGGRGPMSLPRVRPVGVRVSDERWVAKTEAGLSLQPTAAKGLAWIDPKLIASTPEREKSGSAFREALAWRWLTDRAEARVERERVESEATGSVVLVANLTRDRLSLDWTIRVPRPQGAQRTLLLAVTDPVAPLKSWRFTEEGSGLDVPFQSVNPAKHPSLILPENSEAWELRLPSPARGPFTIRGRLDLPWKGRGQVPLLTLADRVQCRNVVLVQESREVRSKVESDGLERLDPSVTAEALELISETSGDAGDLMGTRRRAVHAFSYLRRGGRLALTTERLDPAQSEGVIDRAVLTTFVDPAGPSRHCLALRVASNGARSLTIGLPAGATLLRARRDGQPLVPIETDGGFSLPLNGLVSSRGISTIALDYLTPMRDAGADRVLRPERPASSMPFLAFRWEIVAPKAWRIDQVRGSLTKADPDPAESWIGDVLGGLSSSWDPRRSLTNLTRKEIFDSFDRRGLGAKHQEITLGELLTRFDVGPWPIVVDAMALEAAGLGPKSKTTLAEPAANTAGASSARMVLGSMGVMLVPIGDMILATTRAESPERAGGAFQEPGGRDGWIVPMRAATAWGSDGSDRLQSVPRWLGEVTPRSRVSGELVDFETLREGWRIWRFSALGWPEQGISVRLVNTRVHQAWRWGCMVAMILAGVAARNLPRRVRSLGLATLVAIGILISSTPLQGRFESVVTGILVGALAVLFYWLGRAWKPGDRPRMRTAPNSSLVRVPAGVALLLAVALGSGLLTIWDRPARAQAEAARTILIAFPFEGQADPARKPDRAILRLDDYEYLKSLAERAAPATLPGVSALGVTHRVTSKSERQWVVESEYELVADGSSPATWSVPVGAARDLVATLDGALAPLQISDAGRVAMIAVSGPGTHHLSIKRTIVAQQSEAGENLLLPINPLAAARVVVQQGPESATLEIPGARGKVAARGSNIEGDLGPIDQLELRWLSKRKIPRTVQSGTVDGLILWDAEPAGDRVRARLTYRNPGGSSRIRLQLQPGLIIRPVSLPGLLDATWQGTPERPEWVASVEPPLPDGAAILLEFWRPRDPSNAANAAARRLPVVEPVGVERYSGAIGFRRPADWTGRLATLSGLDSITEEAFVRAWGTLPAEPLTLSGAMRFTRAPELSIATGPPRDRPSVQPRVRLTIGPGRLGFDMRIDLRDPSGTTNQLAFEVSRGLRIVQVDGDGLTDWGRDGDTLRLRFDGASAKRRQIRVQGWEAVISDPLSTIATSQDMSVPWPDWVEAEARPGMLSIDSPTPFQLATNTGVAPLEAVQAEPDASAALPHRRSFQVTTAEGLGKLRWEVEPARINVAIRSHVTIHPDWAEWVAVVRYEVSGGACDAVHLRLPSTWASTAEVAIAGDTHQLTSEARDATTFWAIRPERPFWGSQQLIVRATRPISAGETLAFPDLNPLGKGSVDTYLAITNASGRELATEGSPGVQQIDDRNQFLDDVFTLLPGFRESVFHVRSTSWSLKVIPSRGARLTGADARPARVALADLGCEVMGDGSVLGLARYEVEPHSGTFLPLELPAGAELLWTSVNNLAERALKSVSGQWVIPIDDEAVSHVSLIWRGGPVAPEPLKGQPVSLPTLTQAKVTTLLTVRAPATVKLVPTDRRLVAVPRDRIETEKAEWLKRSIQDELVKIDRSSLRDRSRLMSALLRFELVLRSADRSAAWDPSSLNTQGSWVDSLRHRLRVLRSSLLEPIEMAGLEELPRRVQAHMGQVPENAEDASIEVPEPLAPVRLQHSGQPHHYLIEDTTIGESKPTSLLNAELAPKSARNADEQPGLVLTAMFAPVVVCGLLSERVRTRRVGALASVVALFVLGVIAGPLVFVAAIALVLVGRYG